MDPSLLERHIRDTPVKGSPAQMRAAFLQLAHWGNPPRLPPVTMIGDCPGRWFGSGDRPILWLHGGGYVFGGSDSHAAPAMALSQIAGRPVFVADYPLAPDHPWPAQPDAIDSILRVWPACDVVGDSAGGHLALVMAQRRPGAIRRLAVLSPNTDRSGRSTTRDRNTPHDLMNDAAQDRHLGDLAFGTWSDTDVQASPLLGILSGLPPLFMTAAMAEVLLDDTLLFATAAVRAGAAVTQDVLPGLFHMWHLWPDGVPQARQTLTAVARHLA